MAARIVDQLLSIGQKQAPQWEISAEDAFRHVRKHGEFSLAWKTLERRELATFGDERGFIAYAQKMGSTVALGDPLAPVEEWSGLVGDFRNAFGNPAFAQISETMGAVLSTKGWRVTPFGYDTVIDLPGWDFAGKNWEGIRQASNWMERNGFSIKESTDPAEVSSALDDITQQWRADKLVKKREMEFLNRGHTGFGGPQVRYFFAIDEHRRKVGVVAFDPLWKDGRIVGYVTAMKRKLDEATAYAEPAITRHAIEIFRDEGLQKVRLGLSPLAGSHRTPGRASLILGPFLRFAHNSALINSKILNTKGMTHFKKRFRGREEPLYFATRPGRGVLDFIAALRLSKLV